MRMKTGKVWLVGAGPGDEGLLTVKGLKILENSQVVVYDALVGDAILTHIPANAEIVYVGKRASHHTMTQETINQTLVRYAKQGKRVVRLKGGDPFLFGRGGEEVEELLKENIPYEIIPGIPSAIAVPAYNGIPVTHRDYCSSVHIITGHKKKDEPLDIDFESLNKIKGTFVFLMGVSALPDICNGFIHAGMKKDMPAAVLAQGTTSYQKRIVATVGTLESRIEEEGIRKPAIIVIGNVCGLSKDFEWYEKLPLSGKRIVVTRPKDRSGVLSDRLRDLGAEVLEIPAIRTAEIKKNDKYNKAVNQLEEYCWLVFTSPSGVNILFDKLINDKIDIRKLVHAKVAAIGKATKHELEKRGIMVDVMPEKYEGKELGKIMAEQLQEGDHVLILRAKEGGQELVEEMQKVNSVVIDDVPIYETIYTKKEPYELISRIPDSDNIITVFTSASTVKGFSIVTDDMEYRKVRAVCIGKQTQKAADELGMKTYVSKEATIESLVDEVVRVSEMMA